METLADLVAAGRDRDGNALAPPERSTPYSYDEICTGACKAGNLLRHYGAHPGATVAVVVGPKEAGREVSPGRLGSGADPLLAILGATLVGATAELSPGDPVSGRALVAPAAWLDRYDLSPGCTAIAYGGPPTDADVVHFERERWGENPVAPPESVSPDDAAVSVGGSTFSHGALADGALDLVEQHGIEEGARVGLDAPLDSVGALLGGVLAPVAAGATIVPLPPDVGPEAVDEELDFVVSTGAVESVPVLDPAAISAGLDTRRA